MELEKRDQIGYVDVIVEKNLRFQQDVFTKLNRVDVLRLRVEKKT